MKWYKETITIATSGKGLYSITKQAQALINLWHVQDGMLFLYCPHTSASLLVNEDYDLTARADMETFLELLVPDYEGWHKHTLEGDDDASSHLRATLTPVSVTIPVDNGQISLGNWQGIFLFEHRSQSNPRQIYVRCLDISQ